MNYAVFAIGFNKQVAVLFLIYMGYLLFGSLCFVMLETATQQKKLAQSLEDIKTTKEMIDALRLKNYSDKHIGEAFTRQHEQKQSVNESVTESGWAKLYVNKVFFAWILISTIGYGNVVPNNVVGQIACIIYVLLGIPLCVTMVRLMSFKFRGGLRQSLMLARAINENSSLLIFVFGVLFFVVWLIALLFVPAFIFTNTEHWNYSKALYFSFVTLSTIGLGDYVIGEDKESSEIFLFSSIAKFIWMVIGVGFMSMALYMISYIMGVAMLDYMVDSKCQDRALLKRKYAHLFDMVKELNWQLCKYTPEGFDRWEEIEEFKDLLAERPEDVTVAMMEEMFEIVVDLKEKAYNQLYKLQGKGAGRPRSAVIDIARDTMPEVLSSSNVSVRFGSVTTIDPYRQPDSGKPRSSIVIDQPVGILKSSSEAEEALDQKDEEGSSSLGSGASPREKEQDASEEVSMSDDKKPASDGPLGETNVDDVSTPDDKKPASGGRVGETDNDDDSTPDDKKPAYDGPVGQTDNDDDSTPDDKKPSSDGPAGQTDNDDDSTPDDKKPASDDKVGKTDVNDDQGRDNTKANEEKKLSAGKGSEPSKEGEDEGSQRKAYDERRSSDESKSTGEKEEESTQKSRDAENEDDKKSPAPKEDEEKPEKN